MKRKRIVVTGMGVTSCVGMNPDEFYQNLLAGKSGIKPITQFPCEDYPTRFAGWIPDFDSGDYIDKKQARRIDRCLAFAMVAGKKALEHAQLGPEHLMQLDRQRCGVLVGTGIGGMSVFADGITTLVEKGVRKISPFFIPYTLTNMAGGLLAIDIGFMGPNYSISSACATASHAIISAAAHIRHGDADLMICGGVEAPVTPVGLAGFCALKALSTRNDTPEEASRPWTRARDGFVMGEGAGILVLESLEHALKRGAKIYAEYLGGGLSCDAHHITELREDGGGLVLCMRHALADAGIRADQVDYVNAHATSTPQGDMVEILAMKKVLPDPSKVFVNATKSMTGHALGAAGGIEAIATTMAIVTGKIHPTRNFSDPEPNLQFNIPTRAVAHHIKAAMSNSFGFGGHNATLVFAPFQ